MEIDNIFSGTLHRHPIHGWEIGSNGEFFPLKPGPLALPKGIMIHDVLKEGNKCNFIIEFRIGDNFPVAKLIFDNKIDYITESVREDLKRRSEVGIKKYNTTLSENNHQNMLQHAYEEALDLAQYLKKEITNLNTIQDLVKKYPNDQELGEIVRKIYG